MITKIPQKDAAVQSEQQQDLESKILIELQYINQNLKDISDTLLYVWQYGMNVRC